MELGAISRFITAASGCGATLQTELLFLVMQLCHKHTPAVTVVRAMHCRVVVPSATGAPAERDATGLEVLQQLLGHNCSEEARACACAVLGEIAVLEETCDEEVDVPGTGTQLTVAELQRMYDGDTEGLAPEDVEPRKRRVQRQVPLRGLLFREGALEPMLEALFDVTMALLRREGAPGGDGAAGSGAGSTQRGKRASHAKAALQVCCPSVHGPFVCRASPFYMIVAASPCGTATLLPVVGLVCGRIASHLLLRLEPGGTSGM